MRFLMILAALPLVACGSISMGNDRGEKVTASGGGGSRSFPVADFTGVELAGADDVDVKVGGAFSVRADGPAEELDKLEIRKDGATLKVGRQRNAAGWSSSSKGVKVYVTMPAIQAASLAGSGNLTVDRVQATDFDGDLAGSGDLRIGQLAATSASLNIAGSGGIGASGQVQRLKVAIAGSGDIDAPGLKAAQADVSIAGSGNVAAEVNGPATISIMGSGDVTLGGKPQCTTTKMGSGDVTCG
jgi:hypothetical protein